MKKIQIVSVLIFLVLSISWAQNNKKDWKLADNPIFTKWASDVDPLKPWAQYPRPDMVRNEWINLNGLWDYAITPKDAKPEKWDGKILVPYPVESAISGVKKRVSENENLWYKRSFKILPTWNKKHVLLNFEACDWETVVWIDGKEVGNHRGGYDPFTFDITHFLSDQKIHELLVRVWDPTDKGDQPRGKQVSKSHGIWYTSTTGIWQTVWLEPVGESYISSFRTVTNADNGIITFDADVKNAASNSLTFTIKKDGKEIASASGNSNKEITVQIKNPILWSPDKPCLYDITIELKNGNKTLDKVTSYTGIRKIAIGKTADGFTRMLLNNEFVFENGLLDQGFWPSGIYTPPTEKAMVYDLEMTKKMGYNLIRKHTKVESRIFYYWCDRLGILVWQDMPGGSNKHIPGNHDYEVGVVNGGQNDAPDVEMPKEAAEQYEFELKRMIETKYNHPSIVMWVPFNEAWGQFETGRITQQIADYDPTRLVDSASGGNDRGTGNVYDVHHYSSPVVPPAEEKRAIALGEFGGLGLPEQGHLWKQKDWGYKNMEDSTLQILSIFESYYDQIHRYVKENGLSATIFTQTTDVETEINGLMTYDRKINKLGVENVFRATHNFIPPSLVPNVKIFKDNYVAELMNYRPGGKIFYTTDGSEPNENSKQYTEPFKLSETITIKAFTKWKDIQSRVISYHVEKKM